MLYVLIIPKLYVLNYNFFNSVDISNIQQQGFQSSLSCRTAVFALQETILNHIERHSDVYVASLDQKAAFDAIGFRALFLKVGILGISDRLLMSVYDDFMSVVRILVQDFRPNRS